MLLDINTITAMLNGWTPPSVDSDTANKLVCEWKRKLERRCVICGEKLRDRTGRALVCRSCSKSKKGSIIDKRTARMLLMQSNDTSSVGKSVCTTCGEEFDISTSRARRAFEMGGVHMVDLCPSCLRIRCSEARRVAERARARKYQGLRYFPFSNLR